MRRLMVYTVELSFVLSAISMYQLVLFLKMKMTYDSVTLFL
jgi:hypothetical protein